MADRWALIEDGVVVNVVLAESDPVDLYPDLLRVRTDDAGPGDLYDGQTFTRRPETEEEAAARTAQEIRSLVVQALGQLTTIIERPPVSFSNIAQAQVQVREIQSAVQFEARVLRRLIRLNASLLDATD